jgi:hypothetical protein
VPLKMKKTFLMFVDGLRACANVFPAPMRERVEDSRNPFAPASPRDFRRLTVSPVWRICGEEGGGLSRVRKRFPRPYAIGLIPACKAARHSATVRS